MNPLKNIIEQELAKHVGKPVLISGFFTVGGGCINHAQKIETNAGTFFIKTNDAARYPGMFEAEAKGLDLLKLVNAIRVPEVITSAESEGQAFIILEFIHSSVRGKMFWENFGHMLANLHRNTSEHFGLNHDNYIGSLTQSNLMHDDWISFFIGERLQRQVHLASENGLLSHKNIRQFESLYHRIEKLFPNEPAALVHGDLWSGNFMTGNNGEACIIDPAIHYGHREAELAFTQLFGGFDARFYRAYNEVFPLHPGFENRKDVYNLYPLLVHVNLFGGGYLASVENTLARYA